MGVEIGSPKCRSKRDHDHLRPYSKEPWEIQFVEDCGICGGKIDEFGLCGCDIGGGDWEGMSLHRLVQCSLCKKSILLDEMDNHRCDMGSKKWAMRKKMKEILNKSANDAHKKSL